MHKQQLPQDFRAEWIWSADPAKRPETYLFFRKELVLDDTPSSAELWVTAQTFFHLYVNGRHVAYGPPPHPRSGRSYLCRYEVGYLLEPGVNVIAVLAHNTRCNRFAVKRQAGGLLLQIDINGKPACWSNNSWQMLADNGFACCRPRRSIAAGFSEKIDGGKFPHGWQERTFNPNNWRLVDFHRPLRDPAAELVPLGEEEALLNWDPAVLLSARGSMRRESAEVHVGFEDVVGVGGGVYAAETFLYAEEDATLEFDLYSDNPYVCLFNEAWVKEQGVTALPAGAELDPVGAPPCREAETAGVLSVRKGWNRLLVCQLVEPGAPGFTFLFHGQTNGPSFLRTVGENAMPGWNLAGPLRAPLANITPSLCLDDLALTVYHQSQHSPVDEAVLLLAHSFQADAGALPAPVEPPSTLALGKGEYAVFDWGRILFGVPVISIDGPPLAEIDIVYDEELEDGRPRIYPGGRQNVDSVILGPTGKIDWQGCAPRGLRYLMLVVRKAVGSVLINQPSVCSRKRVPAMGSFESSDDGLNQIWQTGKKTMDVTAQGLFMDAPGKETAQYIPDSMIQALAFQATQGDFEAGARALREFATAQLETGEMPAVCPSDNYVNIPDYALLWPVWLHRHYMNSGDPALLAGLFPALERLLTYFAAIADPETGLLTDLEERFGAPCFLDHGEIDREGTVTGLNALYCRSLQSGAFLAEQAGKLERVNEWCRRAVAVGQTMRDLALNPDTGLFADCCRNGVRSEAESWQTNVLALYGGLAREDEYDGIFDCLFSGAPPYLNIEAGDSENPYFKFFVLEVALALGHRAWALELVRYYWGGMLKNGALAWWEFFNPQAAPGQQAEGSKCHGYGVYPNIFLAQEVSGIRPARPGFAAVYFNPILDGVAWVKAEIPTPHGTISVNWCRQEDGELRVVINSSYPVEVIPQLDASVLAQATFSVGDDVSIMVADEDGGTDQAG